MHEALGSAFNSLQHIKDALDPHGIMNPGKMGSRRQIWNVRLVAMEASQRWDTAALRMGAMVSLIFAIPFSIGASWLPVTRQPLRSG